MLLVAAAVTMRRIRGRSQQQVQGGRGVEVCVGGNASPPLANSPATLLPALNLSKRVCARARVQFVQTFPATSMVPSKAVPSHPDAASTASFRCSRPLWHRMLHVDRLLPGVCAPVQDAAVPVRLPLCHQKVSYAF